MLKTCMLNKSLIFYYDLERKTIARFPTKSNIKPYGSDNSLYFGLSSVQEIKSIFCSLLDVSKISEIINKKYSMKCGNEIVDVYFNINREKQVQIKIMNDGTMCRLTNNYSFDQMQEFDFTKMLIVVDILNKEVRFKNPDELFL